MSSDECTVPATVGAPGSSTGRRRRRADRGGWWWVPGATTVVVIVGVIAVTLWQLHFNLLFTETTTTGGDTGAHIALPAYLETLLSHGHLTGWDPGWYDGYSLYTFYFVLPDLDHPLRHRLQTGHRPGLGPLTHRGLGMWSALSAPTSNPDGHGRLHAPVSL
jgi:hypothetical protein